MQSNISFYEPLREQPFGLTGWGRLLAVVMIFLLGPLPTWGQNNATADARTSQARRDSNHLVTPATQVTIDKGLEYLVRQQMANGSIGSGQYRENIAVASLAGLAFLSQGSSPGRGPYGESLNRLLDFVLANVSPSGFVCVQRATSHGPMYDHGFGTLFLAESYGMTSHEEARGKLKKAIRLIIDTQNHQGGWRYNPEKVSKADLSVTVCQIMALRAARNAGIHVPKNVADQCVEYVRRSQNSDGGFKYMLDNGPSAFPRSAAGLVALYSAGIYSGPEIDRGIAYLNDYLPGRPIHFRNQEYHYFYGHYYAIQAMYQRGGMDWERWYGAIRDELLSKQRRDGSWYDNVCPEYGTAMACIILQIPNNFLPIFQR